MNNFAPAVLEADEWRRASGADSHRRDFQGSSVTPTVNAPIESADGRLRRSERTEAERNSKPNGKLIASAAGSFDMPVGPGQGNGSGGAKGIKGTVASADFGNGVAHRDEAMDAAVAGHGRADLRLWKSQEIAQNTPHVQRVDSGPATTAVEITFKPNPVYTDEARNLKLEGEVLLEVEFAANGQLHVNRVVRGLGHGLDEAAIAAANKMRFKPAQRNGQAMDSTAIVHVVFQLAY
jgi:TonB family protein